MLPFMMARLTVWPALVATVAAGCAGPTAPASGAAGGGVAVYPVIWTTEPVAGAAEVNTRLRRHVEARAPERLIEPAHTYEVAATRGPNCHEEPACVAALGVELGADELLLLRIGALGPTLLLRGAVFDPRASVDVRSAQEVVNGRAMPGLDAALERLVAQLIPAQPATQWYSRWWVWAAGGAVLAGAATTLVLVLGDDDSPARSGADYIIEPP